MLSLMSFKSLLFAKQGYADETNSMCNLGSEIVA